MDDQTILTALRTAMFNLAVSGAAEYTTLGRTFRRVDIADLQKAIEIYERRVAAASGGGLAGATLVAGFHQGHRF